MPRTPRTTPTTPAHSRLPPAPLYAQELTLEDLGHVHPEDAAEFQCNRLIDLWDKEVAKSGMEKASLRCVWFQHIGYDTTGYLCLLLRALASSNWLWLLQTLLSLNMAWWHAKGVVFTMVYTS